MVPKSSKSLLPRVCAFFAFLMLLPASLVGQTTIVATSTTWPTGTYNYTSLTVENGAVLTIGGGSTVTVTGALVVTGNSSIVLQSINNSAQINGTWQGTGVTVTAGSVEVDNGSSINADGQGYVVGAGPGAAASGDSGGGSYGGEGGAGFDGTPAAATYGSPTAPIDLGSGGNVRCCNGVAGAGGGAVRLIVTGTLTNNGIISANGGAASVNGNVTGGGGSGGSVYVTTGGLSGAGVFTAIGGSAGEAGGGGGRVAVYYNGTTSNFTGFAASTATGGTSIGSNNLPGAIGTSAFFDTSAANSNLMVYQDLTIPAGSTVSYNSITVQTGAVLTIGGGSTVNIAQALTISGTVVLQSINNSAQVNNLWAGVGVTLNAATVIVNTNGSINADGQGYVAGAGPGGAVSGDSGGGSYGGMGGAGYGNGTPAAATYGSTTAPIDLGSGGSVRCCGGIAGAGGGAMRLIVSGTLTNNGTISANGAAATGNVTAGGGSGGSIYVTAGGLTGAGVFAANGGGGGVSEGGGGGGRIAVYYNATSGNFTGFATSTATGGTSNHAPQLSGATGTTGFFDTSATNNNLSIYQNFVIPAGTTVNYNSLTVQAGALLTVGGGATVNVAQALTVNGTVVAQAINNAAQVNGAWIGVGVGIQAASVTVGVNGSINADAQGYIAGAGPGAAVAGDSGGGSYGGVGGAGYNGTPAAATYGSTTVPTDLGSGGNVRCCGGVAGAGGGAITLTVSGTLTDNGIISANGTAATGNVTAGGGSGGTVSIHTGTLAGTGAIAVNGGGGGVSEGGGGGGRIAVYYNTNTGFNLASATANGGISNHAPQLSGAAGTVYTLAMGSALTVTDNTALPANANLTYTSITINNGATLTLGSGTTLTANGINVSAASTLTVGGGSTLNVSGAVVVTGNSNVIFQSINNTAQVNNIWAGAGATLKAGSVEVDAGSSINADGQGYLPGAGPGGAAANDSGGGSYGGQGGAGYGNGTPAAATYGSTTAPIDLGSGGSVRCCGGIAGAGGGALTLTVSGTLTNNGIISANGASATGNVTAGAGSGGSVYVTTGGLTGAGVFSANGGGGGVSEGGGGGGRIAVYYNGTSSNFTGFATSTATGGTSNHAPQLSGATGTSAFFDTSATNNNLSVYQNFVIPASTTVSYNSITSQSGALITIGGGSNVTIAGALTVSGTVVAQAINNTAQVNGAWAGSGVTLNAGSITVNTGGSLNADGRGYVAAAGPGAAAANDSGGGSYGGKGGPGYGNGTPAAATYGSTTAPTDLGSGGNVRCCAGVAGVGGGAMRLIVSGTLTNNGNISANGTAATGNVTAGGGSGGSIYATTGGLSGTGVFTANGGGGGVSEGGGGGGRIAIYYNTNTGFNTNSAAAIGGVSNNNNDAPGAPGTVYLLGAGTNLTVAQNTVLPANANLTYTSITVNNAGTLSFGSNSAVTAGSISLSAAATMTVGGGSTVTASGALTVTGNSNIVLQSTNNTGQVNGVWAGTGVTLVAATAQIDPGSSINADGQGYVAGSGPGAAAAGDSGGGSYGGKGGVGVNGQPAASTYGSVTTPVSLGSGGNVRCCNAVPGAGGGAMRFIVTGTLTDNGIISANGGNVVGYQAGGGSGGSVFLVAGNLAGTGTIAANGGGGTIAEAGGGGGRVALYYLTGGGFNLASITAAGGTSNGTAGAAGSVTTVNGPTTVFLQPTASVIHGTANIQWFSNIGGPSTLTLAGPQTATIATVTGDLSITAFDTTQVPDGSYQLVLTVLNNVGQVAQQIDESVVINNSVAWHSGTLTTSQTWSGPQVQALDGLVIVPAGVTLTILPGTIVKALPGAEIIVQSGGTLIANGTSATSQVIFTTFDDYTVGGNTDFNQGISLPAPGEWNGVATLTGGTFTENSNTILRYVATTLGGSLTGPTTLYSTQVYSISGTLTVPNGVTLNIQPGAIVKFGPGAGMDVQPGATLTANGTLAQPIYFTSYNDISIGGDTNNTGGAIAPAPGDWNSVILDGATVSLQHVQMQYGGGPLNSGNQAGMLETTDNANVAISSSIFANSFYIGIQTGYPNGGGDTVTVTDSVFYGIEDRAINAYPGSTVHVVNDTFDGNAYGPFGHGGVMDVENSVISNSVGTQFGSIEVCCGSTFAAFTNNNVYTTAPGVTNYVGLADPTGTQGNISANPVYMNQQLHDYRPTYGSPLIDAANGTVPNYPLTDSFGIARYNAPLVTAKTGTPDVNGKYPDIGAFEFVQSAPSNIDFTVSNVAGPASATVGNQVTVTWTVTNIGSGTAYGPWHDAVYLVTDPNTNPVEILAGTALEGAGIVLGPGASYNATATVTVPGVTVGTHRWEVKTNVLGEIFEGANTADNTGIALNEVATDLAQVTAGAPALNGSFSGIGQSVYYKVVPSATQTTMVQLALTPGYAGSVQLFVGAGYVPSPQRYDFQQTQFNSATASVVIPAGSTQTYYVTAYAQTLNAIPSPFTIQASTVSFSLTSVTPGAVVNSGSATLTFVGGGFSNATTFALVAANGTTYTSTATFIADSDHADVTFAVGQIPAGKYSAEAINGSSVTLSNAVTLSTGVAALSTSNPNVQVTLDTPEAFRAGFPSVITLHYTNISPDDIPAPLIYVAAGNATISEIAPPCSTCSANYQQQYAATFNSGLVLGINQQGPAGVLPAGATGTIQFMATPISSGTASFYASPDAIDPLAVQYQLAQNLCYQTTGIVEVVCFYNTVQTGAYQSAASFCAGITPVGTDNEGQQRACMALLNNAGYSYQNLRLQGDGLGLQSYWNQYQGAHLTASNFNALLAADATALSKSGIYTYDVQTLLGYELQKDGLSQLTTRYHQGAFGFGKSQPFDVKLQNNQVYYLDGTVRSFTTLAPGQTNVFLGNVGDYATLTLETDSSYLLTEANGTLLHFLPTSGVLDYVQDHDGNRISVAYANNLVSSATDNVGNTISFVYDSLGHVTQSTDALGRVTTYTYDVLNDTQRSTFLRSYTDSNGTTSITWNEGGPSGVGYFDDSCVATYCEPAIGITNITYPDGSQANYTYDAVGRVSSISGNGGSEVINFAYNSDGSITTTDALGKSARIAPNQISKIASYTDPLGNLTKVRYDGEGKPINIIGPLGDSSFGTYDGLGNLNGITSAKGSIVSLSYTADESLTALTDPNGNASTYGYNGTYDFIAQSFPNGSNFALTYNSLGLPLTFTNRRGKTITFTYTPQGLISSRTFSNGQQITYTYDGHQNLTSVTAPLGTTRLTWNAADKITGQTNPDGTSLTYTYNGNGQRASMTDSTGFVTNYTYDALGRLSGLTDSAGANIVTYGYDAAGQLNSKTLGNGTSISVTRDADGNVTSLINYSASKAVLSEFDYTFDAKGHPLTMKAPNGTYTYTYDLDGQLTSVAAPNATVQYSYDASGNRTSVTTNGIAATYEPNNLNEYQVANNVAYQYDADGNLISGNGYTYTYDDEGKLLTMVSATDNWSYQYDGLNERVVSTHNGNTVHYLIDPLNYGYIAAEFNGTGSVLAHYTFGLDLTSTTPAGGTADYYHFDATGNTAQITNAAGNVVNSYTYLPFGEQTVLSAGIANPFTYNAQVGVQDDGSGLYFMRSRNYNSTIGRFNQPDPYGYTRDINLYRYAANSPVQYIDPTGADQAQAFIDATTSGTPVDAFNASAPQVQTVLGTIKDNPAATGASNTLGIIGLTSTSISLGNNLRQGNGLGSLHDSALLAAAFLDTGLNYAPKTPLTYAVQYIAHNASVFDVVSYNVLNDYFQNEQELNPDNPFARPPPACGTCLTHKTPPNQVPVNAPIDPNGKLTSGYGDNGYVPAGAPITYTVYFENQPSATLSAQKVTVTDQLAGNLDWSTVQFDNISFNNVSLTTPTTAQTYTTQPTSRPISTR